MRMPFAELSAEEVELRAREGSRPTNLQLVIANAPNVARNQMITLRATTAGLDPALVELVILQQAVLNANAYCWGHHVPVAVAAGYTEDQLRALRGGDLSLLDDRDRAVAGYVRAVFERTVGDAQLAAMRGLLDDETLVKVTVLVGVYTTSAMTQAAMDVPQDDGFGGFECP